MIQSDFFSREQRDTDLRAWNVTKVWEDSSHTTFYIFFLSMTFKRKIAKQIAKEKKTHLSLAVF